MKTLKIAVLSSDIVWADREENLFITEKTLSRLEKGIDIAVLPELFNIGFVDTPELIERLSEDSSDSSTILKLKEWSHKYNCAIAGSLLIKEGEKYFNRAFFVEPSGETTFYDKKHLFRIGNESRYYNAGSKTIPIIRFRGWNIALAVCYDLRFPAWLRNQRSHSYDLLIIPANWPQKREYAWRHLLIARAIENQAYVVGANRSGSDDSGAYDNNSFVFDYLGQPVHDHISKDTEILTAELHLEPMLKYRQTFPVLNDADIFRFC